MRIGVPALKRETVATDAGEEELFGVELLADLAKVGGAVCVAEGSVSGKDVGEVAGSASHVEGEGLGCCCRGKDQGGCAEGSFGEHVVGFGMGYCGMERLKCLMV